MLNIVCGSISNGQVMIDNMCIIVDTETGSIMKYGDRDNSDIVSYYDNMQTKLRNIGYDEMADSIQLITFDRYEGKLSIEEICTIVNYGMNAHSESFTELFKMSLDVLKERLKELNSFGY